MAKSSFARWIRPWALVGGLCLGSCAAPIAHEEAAGSPPSWHQLCRAAAPDLLPASPIRTTSILFADGRGSGNEATEAMRAGFDQVSFDIKSEALAEGAALPAQDSRRWTLVPLHDHPGPVTIMLAPLGTPACEGFEREIDAQRTAQSTADPMRFYTDRRLPPAPPGQRNWCLAALVGRDPEAIVYRRKVDLLALPRAHVTRIVETLEQAEADPALPSRVLARRTFLQRIMLDGSGVETGVGKDCAGKPNGPQAPLIGQQGLALRPLNAPNLVTVPPAKAG